MAHAVAWHGPDAGRCGWRRGGRTAGRQQLQCFLLFLLLEFRVGRRRGAVLLQQRATEEATEEEGQGEGEGEGGEGQGEGQGQGQGEGEGEGQEAEEGQGQGQGEGE